MFCRDSEVSALEYRKVRVRGKFDHAGEMYLGPRSLLLDGESAYHGKLVTTSANKSSGYQVVTPFILSESKYYIYQSLYSKIINWCFKSVKLCFFLLGKEFWLIVVGLH